MKKFNKINKFEKRESGRSDRQDSESRNPERRTFKPKTPRRSFERTNSNISDRRDSPVELTEVICYKCGKKCEVPFKPDRSKPVYCRECFKGNDSSRRTRPDAFKSRGRPSGNFRPRETPNISSGEFAKINQKLDKIMKILGL
jgi:CxxC-x17-CxxC domain-containing protein